MKPVLGAEDFAESAKLMLKGRFRQALVHGASTATGAGVAALVAQLGPAAALGPILSAAGEGLVERVLDVFADSATQRLLAAGHAVDLQRMEAEEFRRLLLEVSEPWFLLLRGEIRELGAASQEQFLQTLRVVERIVASSDGHGEVLAQQRELLVLVRDLCDRHRALSSQERHPGVTFEGPFHGSSRALRHFGAEDNIETLGLLLRPETDVACVVIQGVGGVGKTSLAQEFVARHGPVRFPDGAIWIEANALVRELVRVARFLGWNETRDPNPEEASRLIVAVLSPRRVLLVLDDVDLRSHDLRHLPIPGGESRTLMTSRDQTLTDELPVKNSKLELEGWSLDTSRRYLRSAAPAFVGESDTVLDALARFVDGLPLALALVASQPQYDRGLSATDLLGKLEAAPVFTLDRFVRRQDKVLRRGVLQTFSHALTQLSDLELQVLRALATCANGTREVVVGAVAERDVDAVRRALNSLADVSLVRYSPGSTAAWGLHELVRMVVAADGLPSLLDKHEAWVFEHCVAHAAPDQFQQIDDAFPEVLLCCERLLQGEKLEKLSTLLSILFQHLLHRGKFATAIELIEALLARTDDDSVQATWLGNLGILHQTIGDTARAIDLHKRSLELCRKSGFVDSQASCHGNLGICYELLGDRRQAISHHEQALLLERLLDRREGYADELGNLAMCYVDSDTPRAIGLLQSSLELERALGRLPGQAAALSNLGHCYRVLGDLPRAISYHQVALAFEERIGRLHGQAAQHRALAQCWRREGNLANAIDAFRSSARIESALGDTAEQADCLLLLGRCHRERDELGLAIGAFEAALALNERRALLDGQADALNLLVSAYADANRDEEARAAAKRLITLLHAFGYADDSPEVCQVRAAIER